MPAIPAICPGRKINVFTGIKRPEVRFSYSSDRPPVSELPSLCNLFTPPPCAMLIQHYCMLYNFTQFLFYFPRPVVVLCRLALSWLGTTCLECAVCVGLSAWQVGCSLCSLFGRVCNLCVGQISFYDFLSGYKMLFGWRTRRWTG